MKLFPALYILEQNWKFYNHVHSQFCFTVYYILYPEQLNSSLKFQLICPLLKLPLTPEDELFPPFLVLLQFFFHSISLNKLIEHWDYAIHAMVPKEFHCNKGYRQIQRWCKGQINKIGREPISVWKNTQEYVMSNDILKAEQKLCWEERRADKHFKSLMYEISIFWLVSPLLAWKIL